MSDNEIVQVNFRMPKELKDKLEYSATVNGRSITSELTTRLEDSFAGVTNTNEFSEKLQDMAGELVALSTENRELRRLYTEAVNSNFDKIPKGLKSKYGVLLNELLEDEKKPTD